jgi:hypothetical protein
MLIAQRLLLQTGRNTCMEQGWLKRFWQIIFCAQLNALHHAFKIIHRRNDNNGNMTQERVRFQFTQHRKTIHDGHHDVQQDQVRFFIPDLIECFPAVVGCDDAVIQLFKFLLKIIHIEWFVVDNQDFGLCHIHVSICEN